MILEKGMIHQIMMKKKKKDNYQVNGLMNDEMPAIFCSQAKKGMLWKYKQVNTKMKIQSLKG